MTLAKVNFSTILGIANLIEGFERANIMLLNGTRFHINDILYSSKSRKWFLNFKDICGNEYPIESMNKVSVEYLYISIISNQKLIESYIVVNQEFKDPKFFYVLA